MRAIVFLLMAVAPLCHGEVYRKVDPLTGHVTFTNVAPRSAVDDISKPPVGVMTAPVTAAPGPELPRHKPRRSATQPSYPTISKETQRERDVDRRAILMSELDSEKKALLIAADMSGEKDTVARHRANIESLKRELALVK